jgi:hypothetical protein
MVRLQVWQTQSVKPATSPKKHCEERSDEASEELAQL